MAYKRVLVALALKVWCYHVHFKYTSSIAWLAWIALLFNTSVKHRESGAASVSQASEVSEPSTDVVDQVPSTAVKCKLPALSRQIPEEICGRGNKDGLV